MTTMRTVGVVALGMTISALIGGGIYYLYRRRQNQRNSDIIPSKPPRDVEPDPEPTVGEHADRRARGGLAAKDELPDVLESALRKRFGDTWPPGDDTIDKLTTEDVVIVAAKSEPVPGYELSRTELIAAKVRSVEQTHVRARVVGPVEYAEHLGAHAGHGFRVGDLIEVPRPKVLVAARSSEPKREGFNSEGEAAGVFEPSNVTKQTYTIRPGTPYDLVLPYRSPDLEWSVDRDKAKLKWLGSKGNYQQIMFTEDSMRGPVTVRVHDRDPKTGLIFVAHWEFHLNP